MTVIQERGVEAPTELMPNRPTNVVAALARVMAELGGIDKLTAQQRSQRGMGGGDTGIKYAYRGIDQIAGAAQPLLGRYGVVIVPDIVESRVEQIVVNERPWSDTWVRVRWDIYGPGGIHDRIEAVTEGLGRDNADKGQNKAMTGAYKNLLLRLLCIGDSNDDSDGHTYERDQVDTRPQPLSDQWVGSFRQTVTDAGLEPDEVIFAAFGNLVPDPLMPEHIQPMRDAFRRLREAADPPELRHDEKAGVTGVPELPLESGPNEPDLPAAPPDDARPITSDQVGRIKAEYRRLGIPRDGQIEFTGLVLGHDVVSHNQLTADEGARVLAELKSRTKPAAKADDP